MSEYWKSTPKYWCKHCKTFVRDTKLEKQNHEATPRHQGNLSRFLRDLHRGHEREERDAQRAKDEIARLNGIAGGFTGSGNAKSMRKSAISPPTNEKQFPAADRKRQLQQLADMGVAVPEEARREMAMAGDWQLQSVKPIYEKVETVHKRENVKEQNPSALTVGVRKRRFEGDDEKGDAGEIVVKKGWGATIRILQCSNDDDLEALLETTKDVTQKPTADSGQMALIDSLASPQLGKQSASIGPSDEPPIKREDSEATDSNDLDPFKTSKLPTKDDGDAPKFDIVFKKRKAKPFLQKN